MSGEGWAGVEVAGVTAAYALGSRRLASSPVSSVMVFVGCGVLLGPVALDVVDLKHGAEPVKTTATGRKLREGTPVPESARVAPRREREP
ncbi:hypothetical protein ACWEQ3_05825 [Streptomyces mirabilis]